MSVEYYPGSSAAVRIAREHGYDMGDYVVEGWRTNYNATLDGRSVQIVELNANEHRNAYVCGCARCRDDLRDGADTFQRGGNGPSREQKIAWNVQGAQGEIAVARVLGVRAPLDVDVFRKPDIPPNWAVKTQSWASKDMQDGYLRLLARARHPGWRYVLVERVVGLWGRFVFIIHGWIADEQVDAVAVQRYSYSPNGFVNLKRLTSLTRDVYDTVYGAPTDEPPAPAPFDTDEDAGGLF